MQDLRSPIDSFSNWIVAALLALVLPASAVEARCLDTGSASFRGPVEAAGSWVRDEGIVGEERETVRLGSKVRWVWDGRDSAPDRLDATGLGGFDLTARGFYDRLEIDVAGLEATAELALEIYSTDDGFSRVRLDHPAPGAPVLVDLDQLSGVDPRQVGALVIEAGDAGGRARLGSLCLGSDLERSWSRRSVEGIDGAESVEHRLTITNAGSASAGPFEISLVRPRHLAESLQIEGGHAVSEGGVIHARLDALSGGAEAVISFREPAATAGPPAQSVEVVLQEGDMPPGAGGNAVTSLNPPFTSGTGAVGFNGQVDDGGSSVRFIWFDDTIVFLDSDEMGSVLSGGEGTMGIADNGDFVYSPSIDGADGAWTEDGQLAVEEVQAPGFPDGTISTFHSRPTMLPGGAAYWVSGFNESGGTSSEGRMLYTSPDHQPGSTAVVLRADDVIEGLAIDRPSGVGFDYLISDDGSHHIQELLMDTGGTSDDGVIYLDGALIARESEATGDGDNWDNFDLMSVNDSGDHVFSGDTDGASGSDEFIAYNGTIAVREGAVLDGVTLTSSASVRALSINNLGQVAHAWDASGTEVVFFACDGADLAGTSQLVVTVGDGLDVTGDGVADATLTDLNASTVGPGLALAEDGRIVLEVDLDFGGGEIEAIVAFTAPSCVSDVAINEVRTDQPGMNDDDYFELVGDPAAPLDGLTYLVIGDGPGGSGSIESVIDLAGAAIPGDGFFLAAEGTFTLDTPDLTAVLNFEEDDNVTHLLVSGFTGALDDDLDGDDDCALDSTPWTAVIDGLALILEANPPGSTECHYGTDLGLPVVGPSTPFGPGPFAPVHVGRDPDATGPWIEGDADPAAGSDTPGASNEGVIPVELMHFTVD